MDVLVSSGAPEFPVPLAADLGSIYVFRVALPAKIRVGLVDTTVILR